ncbi:hypothetical protein B0A49_06209 [Cryomyces minteri]|uniref:Spo7-like protein n=1 Tax=Cryomyces minteri TaxID=331657 RepID=A0A4U0X3M2_9PEZI|nr:hypothetical protein B0A49_06209 [Cryomyces minteri]
MSESKLDQIVKGAPPPHLSPSQLAQAASQSRRAPTSPQPPFALSDPLNTLPSSPPQIYLNLLILEASLRSQYLTLRARRRLHTLGIVVLAAWNLLFTYLLFLRPRYDAFPLLLPSEHAAVAGDAAATSGIRYGGSAYRSIEMTEKLALLGGLLTALLFWGTGQWKRGVRWPRKWAVATNRGLRGFGLKVVVVRGPWVRELCSWIAFFDPMGRFLGEQASNFQYVMVPHPSSNERPGSGIQRPTVGQDGRLGREGGKTMVEEDIAPSGDYVKLLLLPKPFSSDFRENWEQYRTAYWETENKRRALLRKAHAQKERARARAQGGWLWWSGWRGWARFRDAGVELGGDLKGLARTGSFTQHKPAQTSRAAAGDIEKAGEAAPPSPRRPRRPSTIRRDDEPHAPSRSSSRGTTTPELDAKPKPARRPTEERLRRGSSTASIERERERRRGATKKQPPPPLPGATGGGTGNDSAVSGAARRPGPLSTTASADSAATTGSGSGASTPPTPTAAELILGLHAGAGGRAGASWTGGAGRESDVDASENVRGVGPSGVDGKGGGVGGAEA